ncbi:MAG: hypothetical protein SFU56_01110 [Capsulimonadales bacterium]|nr:hypothetical protein [Capsulimonadales bacterium]
MINEEQQIRSWLASDSAASKRHLRLRKESSPPEQWRRLLIGIGQEAGPVTDTGWLVAGILLLIVALVFHNLCQSNWGAFSFVTYAGAYAFFPVVLLNHRGDRRRVGTRAAILLALEEDVRAAPLLANAWYPGPCYDAELRFKTEEALLYLLNAAPTEAVTFSTDLKPVAKMADRLWHAVPARRDLPDDYADLLLAVLRYLHRSDSATGRETLDRFAESETTPDLGNRHAVRETARALRQSPPLSDHPFRSTRTREQRSVPQYLSQRP